MPALLKFISYTLAFGLSLVIGERTTLRSGSIDLRPAADFLVSGSAVGDAHASSGTSSRSSRRGGDDRSDGISKAKDPAAAGGAAAAFAATALGVGSESLESPQLYLMKYKGGTGGGAALRAALEAEGGSVVSYISAATLLVFATPRLVVAVADRQGALMAAYEPGSKVSPEAASAIQAARPARRRRGLLLSADHDSTSRQHHHTEGDATAPAAAPLQHLRNWRPHGPSPSSSQQQQQQSAKGFSWRSAPAFDRRAAAAAAAASGAARGGGAHKTSRNSTTVPAAAAKARGTAAAAAARQRSLQQPAAELQDFASPAAATAAADTVLPADAPCSPPSPGVEGRVGAGAAGAAGTGVAGQDLYGIEVHLVPGLSYAAREEALQQWPGLLAERALGRGDPVDPCQPRVAGEGLQGIHSVWLAVYLCAEDIEDGVAWLSALPTVTWIAPALRLALHNDAAGWTIQSGNLTKDRFNNPTAELRPYWRSGILGQDMLVGVGDSGVDLSHCFFLDARYDIGVLRAALDGRPLSWMRDHRKIVQYVVTNTRSAFGDEGGGHGTHVAGSVAGSVALGPFPSSRADPPTDWDWDWDDMAPSAGAAPLARLSFVDLSPPNSTTIYVPSPFDTQYLPLHYRVGARISSDSWGSVGSDAVVYDSSAQSFDAFAWRNPDFLSVLAASNAGHNGDMVTICTPATAKNVLTVGATVNHPKEVTSFGDQYAFVFQYRNASGATVSLTISPRVGSGVIAWYTLLASKTLPFALASPRGACAPLLGDYSRSVVLVDLGDAACSYGTRAINIMASGAAAAVYMRPDGRFITDELGPLPAVLTYTIISRAQGQMFTRVLTNSTNSKFVLAFWYYPQVSMGIDSVAGFSSYGPLADGRIKPDIVAPGSLVKSASAAAVSQSNATRDTCSEATQVLSGTSMATPLVSGHVALMRQYFRDGFYPRGNRLAAESASFTPSGMLLKAATIVGATSLKGGIAWQTGATLGAAPDGFQGWGRMSMAGALPLPQGGLTGPNFRLQVADMGTIADGEQLALHGIRATGTGPIHAALVWYDYPAALQASSALVNDLDLRFAVNGGALEATREDHINTVERAELLSPRAGDNITFVVVGTRIVHRLLLPSGPDQQLPQRWALAVAGDFRGVLRTQLNPTYARPHRLPAFARRPAPESVRMIVSLASGACLEADGMSLVASWSCSVPYVFEFVEEKDNLTLGYYYYLLRDGSGSCAAFNGSTSVVLSTCDPGDGAHRLAVFLNPHTNMQAFQLVPKQYLGVGSDDRLCLRPQQRESESGNVESRGSGDPLGVAPCDADDPAQAFLIQPPSLPPSPPEPPPPPRPPPRLPPSPAPRPPSPRKPPRPPLPAPRAPKPPPTPPTPLPTAPPKPPRPSPPPLSPLAQPQPPSTWPQIAQRPPRPLPPPAAPPHPHQSGGSPYLAKVQGPPSPRVPPSPLIPRAPTYPQGPPRSPMWSYGNSPPAPPRHFPAGPSTITSLGAASSPTPDLHLDPINSSSGGGSSIISSSSSDDSAGSSSGIIEDASQSTSPLAASTSDEPLAASGIAGSRAVSGPQQQEQQEQQQQQRQGSSEQQGGGVGASPRALPPTAVAAIAVGAAAAVTVSAAAAAAIALVRWRATRLPYLRVTPL